MSEFPLCELKKNQTAVITGISCPLDQIPRRSDMIRRFLDLGFCKGTSVKCVNTGIFKNPHAYEVRGTVIAIRNEDAKIIMVKF